MDYLIEHFIRVLDSYKTLRKKYTRNSDGSYTIDIYDIPPELDLELSRLSYDEVIGQKETKDKHGRVIGVEKITQTTMCFVGIGEGLNLRLVLDKDTYAKKMNLIDPILRRYFAAHRNLGF